MQRTRQEQLDGLVPDASEPSLDPAAERAWWHAMGNVSFRLVRAAAPLALPEGGTRTAAFLSSDPMLPSEIE